MHFSTDHVFDGDKGEPYMEEDAPNPPSAYAVSKLAGELYARASLEKLYVVRVAGVFGPAGRYTRRGNFPELVIRKAEEHSPLKVVKDFFATPTYAPALGLPLRRLAGACSLRDLPHRRRLQGLLVRIRAKDCGCRRS